MCSEAEGGWIPAKRRIERLLKVKQGTFAEYVRVFKPGGSISPILHDEVYCAGSAPGVSQSNAVG